MLQPEYESLSTAISDMSAGVSRWTQPSQFDLGSPADRREVARRMEEGTIRTTHDAINDIAADMFDLKYPDRKADAEAREKYVRAIGAQGIKYGQWFHFEWDGSLVRYPEASDYRDLKTFRNKNIVTDAEQETLYDATVAVMGLSVGSSVVDQVTMSGIGGTQILADFDTLAPSNLNRMRADISQVGMEKIDIIAQKVSKNDPYIRQVHLRGGADAESLASLETTKPDLIYDEIDDLAIKALLRVYAAENKIPLVMATDVGDTSIIDVERYDLHTPRPFNGKLKDDDVEALLNGTMTEEQKRKAVTRLVGVRNASPRLLQSSMEIGTRLGGMPQLGTTASLGGSLAAVAGREILVGRRLESGRYTHSTKETLHLASQTTGRETVAILSEFLRKNRAK